MVGVVPDVRPGLLNMTPNTPVATAFAPIPVTRFRSASVQGTTVRVRGKSRTPPDGRRPRRVEADSRRLTIFDAPVRWTSTSSESSGVVRIAVAQLAGLSLFGLVLATIGLTGVTSYAVARQRSEIGIRLWFGAERPHVLWLVLREGAYLVVTGAVLCAPRARSLSLVRFPRWIPISLRSWVKDHLGHPWTVAVPVTTRTDRRQKTRTSRTAAGQTTGGNAQRAFPGIDTAYGWSA